MSDNVPDGWTQSKLGKVAKLTMGQSPSSETYNAEGIGLPFFQGKADFGARSPKVRYWCSEPTKVASKNSILFSVRAPVGEVNVTPYECCIGRGLAGIHGDIANQEFLFQKLQYIKPRFQLLSQGSTFEAVNGSDLKDFSLTLPPLPEQQKIATILSSVDNVIETTRAQIDKLKHLKTGMMQELLTKGIGHAEFKDSPVGRIPAGWDCKRLSECTDLITKGATPTTYGYDYSSSLADGGGRFIRGNNATLQGEYVEREVKYICKGANDLLKRSQLRVGDVVISIVGSVGASLQVDHRVIPANINQNVALVRPGDKLDSSYLRQIIVSHIIQDAIALELTVQAQPSISLKQVGDFVIPLPTLDEQREIADVLLSTDTLIRSSQKKLAGFLGLKNALMQDLLTGKVRVKTDEKEKEPAVA